MDENEEDVRYHSNSFAANEIEYEYEAYPEDEYKENQDVYVDFIREESSDYDDEDYEENQVENGTPLRNRRFPKKRKLRSLIANSEIPQTDHASSKLPLESRITPSEWTEHETILLLDAWGEKFVQLGRKSLRSDGWHEVAEQVSRHANVERTDTQCRNRLDTLKKRYKKEKSGGGESGWIHFKKLDMLLSSPSPKIRDSHGESDASEDGGRRRDRWESSSFKVLADSLNSFSGVFEKMERSNRQQMKELEKMKIEFQRELELQKEVLLEKTRDEIRRIHQVDDDDDDYSS